MPRPAPLSLVSDLGAVIRGRWQAKRMHQSELGRLVGYSASWVCRVEANRLQPTWPATAPSHSSPKPAATPRKSARWPHPPPPRARCSARRRSPCSTAATRLHRPSNGPLAPAWHTAPARSLDAFARSTVSVWEQIADGETDPWVHGMLNAAHTWNAHR